MRHLATPATESHAPPPWAVAGKGWLGRPRLSPSIRAVRDGCRRVAPHARLAGRARSLGAAGGLDEAEFEALFNLMRPRLLRVALRQVDADAANDAAISALHTIWTKNVRSPSSAGEQAQLQALAFKILDGNIRNAQRARMRRSRLVEAVVRSERVKGAEEPDTAVLAERNSEEEELAQVLDRLGSREREVVRLVVDGFKVAEIAPMLGCSSGAVSMRLTRARKQLKKLLDGRRADGSQAS